MSQTQSLIDLANKHGTTDTPRDNPYKNTDLTETIKQNESREIENTLDPNELHDRNTPATSTLSQIAQFQAIGCNVNVTTHGDTRIEITRNDITYSIHEHRHSTRPPRYVIGIEFNNSIHEQKRENTFKAIEDALHTLFDCIVNDPRQHGIELKGIAYTDTRTQ